LNNTGSHGRGSQRPIASASAVLEFLAATRSIDIWIDGGWGIDALLTEQTRAHRDLDIVLADVDFERLSDRLRAHDYRLESGSEAIFVSPQGLTVDVHRVRFDDRGYGIFDLPDGRCWPFPPSAFLGEGEIGGTRVRCLSAEAQVQCHAQGYGPTAKDLDDMQALQERFQVVLPLSLCRQ